MSAITTKTTCSPACLRILRRLSQRLLGQLPNKDTEFNPEKVEYLRQKQEEAVGEFKKRLLGEKGLDNTKTGEGGRERYKK